MNHSDSPGWNLYSSLIITAEASQIQMTNQITSPDNRQSDNKEGFDQRGYT